MSYEYREGENKLSRYEKEQVKEIGKWKDEEPGVLSQAFGIIIEPLAWFINKIIPEKAIRGALDFSNYLAKWMADTKDVLRDADVCDVEGLKSVELKTCDQISDEVHNWAIGIGVAEGTATGVFGLPGMAADIPAIITLALRTIHKIGICYGYETRTKEDHDFILAILSAAGANTVEEKIAAISFLRSVEVTITKQTWKKIAEKAVERQMSKEGAIITLKNLAKQLGVNLTKRKALAAIPVIGAAIGGSVNGWFIKEVGWAARRSFQERWLIDNNKIIVM